jgi:hypothetical protein
MTTNKSDSHDRLVAHFIEGLSVDGLRRQRRDEIRMGHPKATEAEIERMMDEDVKRGHLPPAKKVPADNIYPFRPRS